MMLGAELRFSLMNSSIICLQTRGTKVTRMDLMWMNQAVATCSPILRILITGIFKLFLSCVWEINIVKVLFS
jgi:hypothetical protein